MKDLAKKVLTGKLTRRLIPLVLSVAGVIGCATYSNTPIGSAESNVAKPETLFLDYAQTSKDSKKGLRDLGNGYFARTYNAWRNIDIIASALLGEVILKKTDNGYTKITTEFYAGEEDWNFIFNQSCKFADADNKDYILEEDEVNDLLDLTYDVIEKRNNEVQWMEEE